jgi:hypothetical protein
MIRRDLPGWYPRKLLPALQGTLKRLTTPGVNGTDLDDMATHLAEVLQERDETREIAGVLALTPLAPDDRRMRGEAEHSDSGSLPVWIENEHRVLRKIIEDLPSKEEPPAEPSDPDPALPGDPQ